MPLYTPPAAPTTQVAPPSLPADAGNFTAFDFLGIAPMHTSNPQANTLEAELDDYLASPLLRVGVVEFWQVCMICSLLRHAHNSWNCRSTRESGQPSSSLLWT